MRFLLAAALAGLLALVVSWRGATLPAIEPHAFVAPPTPTTHLELCWIDTGGLIAPGRYGTAGFTRANEWDATSAAILVRHPKGDVLIDSGISPTAATEVNELGALRRFVFQQTAGRNVPHRKLVDTLKALGVTRLTAVIVSHAHPDHMGGLTALTDAPVWVAAEEKTFIESGNEVVVPAHARAVKGRLQAIPFTAIPYANSDSSFDVFADGSLVITPAFGHTPGSVLTFVNTPKRRFVHVGDLINLNESIEREVPKSFVMRTLTDEDEAATSRQVARLVELQRADPSLVMLPAHDKPAYVRLFGIDEGSGPPPCLTE